MDSMLEKLWQFARGDLEPQAFEEWFLARSEDETVQAMLGRELVSALLEADYDDPIAHMEVCEKLENRLDVVAPRQCRCLTWRDHQILPLGWDEVTGQAGVLEDFFDYSLVTRRTPWLECVECRRCQQAWYLATDTADDDYHLVRLDAAAVEGIRRGVWPSIFDQWEVVWPTEDWLTYSGFTSLEDWRLKQPPE
jgi:hypothetical protein